MTKQQPSTKSNQLFDGLVFCFGLLRTSVGSVVRRMGPEAALPMLLHGEMRSLAADISEIWRARLRILAGPHTAQ